jgi:hypothetical protein
MPSGGRHQTRAARSAAVFGSLPESRQGRNYLQEPAGAREEAADLIAEWVTGHRS